MNQKYRSLKAKYGEKALMLTPEKKYDIASLELSTLKANIDEGRTKSETLLERLKAILEGTDISIAEIRKEAFDFGRFLSMAENGRIGKYDAEKLSKYMFDKLKQKENLIDKLTSKNVTLKVAILKAEGQIKHKEEMGDDLKFIDFHQMQIANKKHVKDIEDRNKKVLKLKLSSGTTTQALNKLRKNLQVAQKREQEIKKDMEAKTESLEKKKKDIRNTEYEIEKENALNKKQKALQSQMKEMADPLDFVQQKNQGTVYARMKANWERKIEIAELEAKKARAILKRRDQQKMVQGYDFD